jgi:transketolase
MKRLAHEIADALESVARVRDDIWVLDGDLGDSYGLYDEQGRPRFPRFLQAGIAEQALVGVAAGLAAEGRLPWVFSFSAFLCHRAADQIRTCVAHQALPVVLVGSHAGAASGANGSSHSSLSDLGVLGAIGGIDLWAPADGIDVSMAVRSLIDAPRPAYLRASREPVSMLPLLPGRVRSNGLVGEAALLSTGYASHWAHKVVEVLGQDGIAMPWAHVAQIAEPVLLEWIRARDALRWVLVLEDHGSVGGLADAVRRIAPANLAVRSMSWPIGWNGESGCIDDMRRLHRLDTASIVERIREHLE